MPSADLILKRSIKSTAAALNLRAGFPAARAGEVNILAYHRIVADIERAEREAIYGIVLSAETFRRHCEILREFFKVLSLNAAAEFLHKPQQHSLPLAVLTFDDGYLDFYEEAFPILKEFDFPATVFLPTEFIGQNAPLAHDRLFWLVKLSLEKHVSLVAPLIRAGMPEQTAQNLAASQNLLRITDHLVHLENHLRERILAEIERELGAHFEEYPREYRLLNWETVREMAAHGIDFGGHTARHVVLPLEDSSNFKNELANSRLRLEKEIGSSVKTFAYPNGAYDARTKDAVRAAGYEIAVTTETNINRAGAEILALGRISLCEESTRGISGNFSRKVAELRLGV